MEQFTHLRKTLTNQNSIHEEITNRLKSGKACFHSVQDILSSSLLCRNIKYYNFPYCFIRARILASHVQEGTQAEMFKNKC